MFGSFIARLNISTMNEDMHGGCLGNDLKLVALCIHLDPGQIYKDDDGIT